MNYKEAMVGYKSLGLRCAKKGELFVAHKNHSGTCEIVKCFKTFKKLIVEVVVKVDNRD